VNQVVINATAGRIKAGSFEGDGSLLQNVPAGADGAAATIGNPTITTGLAGTEASVTNSGTSSAAVFDFVIPRGDRGTDGTNGDDGDDGAAATIGNPTITTGLAGTEASVTNSGTSSAAVFDFVIPRGDRGTDGTNGTNYFTLSGSNIYRTTGNVGIGTATPMTKLDIECNTAQPSIVFSEPSNSRYQTGIGSIHISGQGQRLDFYTGDSGATGTLLTNSPRMSITGTGNVGIGVTDPQGGLHVQTDNRVHITAGTVSAFTGLSTSSSTGTSRAQLVLNSRYSDLVIASSYVNSNHGSTLTFATVNPSNTAEYRKFVINQGNWGSRKDFLDFGLSVPDGVPRPNPHSSINSTDTVLTLDGNNKRVGIGTMTPDTALHVNGIIKQTGANWSLTNGGVGLGVDEGAHYDDFAYLNRTLSTPTDVTLTHANQGGKNTRSRITINTAGKYAMYTNGFRQTGTSDTTEIFIYKNGAYQHVRAYSGANGTSNYKTAGSAYTIMDLNANDYVELYLEQATFHGNDSIYFAGHLIA
jgi:hypothetical protein